MEYESAISLDELKLIIFAAIETINTAYAGELLEEN
jgi:hypothetical protein